MFIEWSPAHCTSLPPSLMWVFSLWSFIAHVLSSWAMAEEVPRAGAPLSPLPGKMQETEVHARSRGVLQAFLRVLDVPHMEVWTCTVPMCDCTQRTAVKGKSKDSFYFLETLPLHWVLTTLSVIFVILSSLIPLQIFFGFLMIRFLIIACMFFHNRS